MALKDFIKIIDKYDVKKLKEMNDTTDRKFRTIFVSIAVRNQLPELKTEELHTLRAYIDSKVKGTQDASQAGIQINIEKEITDLSNEAEKELRRLTHYCQRLHTDDAQKHQLVEELQRFIEEANERIELASNPPEILYPTVDRDRCYALSEVINQIRSNLELIIPIYKSQPKMPSSPNSSDQSFENNSETTSEDQSEDQEDRSDDPSKYQL